MPISNALLAELLASIARTHADVINAIADPMTVNRQVIPILQARAGLGNQAPMTLQTLYPRLLLQSFGTPTAGKPPLHQYFAQELDRLIPKE